MLSKFFSRDRRKAKRSETHETLYLDYRSPIHLQGGKGEGKDISTRGLRFACHSKFPMGTPLDLTLYFSPSYAPDKFVQLRGYVVRCYRKPQQERYRIACAFDPVNVSTSTQAELNSFLSWLNERNEKYFL